MQTWPQLLGYWTAPSQTCKPSETGARMPNGWRRPLREMRSKQNFQGYSAEDNERAFWWTLSRRMFSRRRVLFSHDYIQCLSWHTDLPADTEIHRFDDNSGHIQTTTAWNAVHCNRWWTFEQASKLCHIYKDDITLALPTQLQQSKK